MAGGRVWRKRQEWIVGRNRIGWWQRQEWMERERGEGDREGERAGRQGGREGRERREGERGGKDRKGMEEVNRRQSY